MKNRPRLALISSIVLLNVGMAVYASVRHYATIDEARMIPAGLAHWDSAAFELANDSPPLARLIATLPILPLNPHRFSTTKVSTQGPPDESEAQQAKDFAYTNPLEYETLIRLARIPTLLWWLLGAWLIAGWAGELHGPRAALFALTLWSFSPNVLARESLATPDLPAAVSCLAATYLFSRWLAQPTFTRAIAVGIALGIALLTDFTALSLFIVWPLLLSIKPIAAGETRPIRRGTRAVQLVLSLACCLWSVNIGYGFSKTGTPLGEFHFTSATLSGVKASQTAPATTDVGNAQPDRNRFRHTWLGSLPVPIPPGYLLGIDRRLHEAESRADSADDDPASITDRGVASLALLWAKIPIAVLIMICWALTLSARCGPSSSDWLVWIPALGITALAFSPAAFLFPLAGMLLPAPFAIIGMSRLARFLNPEHCKAGAVVAILATVMVVGTLVHSPHLLSYLNEATLGMDRRVLAAKLPVGDSGRDFQELKGWLQRHPEASPVGLACQHLIDPRSLGIEYNRVPIAPQSPPPHDPWYAERVGPRPGYFALDAYNLALPKYRYFAGLTPVFTAGSTIQVFHITGDEADEQRRQSGLADTKGLLELKGWLQRHPEASPVGLACQHLIDPRSLGIEYNRVPIAPQSPPPHDPWYAERVGPRPGYFALDAYNLALPKYRYFAGLTPVFTAGSTIQVFHITGDEADEQRRQSGLPPMQKRCPDQQPVEGHGFLRLSAPHVDGGLMNYTLFVPHNYRKDVAYPLILFLHGYGDRGTDGEQYLKVGFPPAVTRRSKDFDFFAIIPQGREGAWPPTSGDSLATIEILKKVSSEYNINSNKIYLTGLSSGGAGVWPLAADSPDRWAAIVPVASAECDPNLADMIKNIPCWCFHNYFDVSKSPVIPRRMIAAIRRAGGRPRYTEFYETTGDRHNAWDRAYNSNELYDWLAEQTKPD